jgi:hypothetical protein
MIEFTKRSFAFGALRAVCLATSDKLLPKEYSGIVSVEKFDIPAWGRPSFGVQEGSTVAVATDARRMVIARTDLDPGKYQVFKMTQSCLQLKRIESEHSFPDWKRIIPKVVENGGVFFGTSARKVHKAWKIGSRTDAWVCEMLYSLGKEGICVEPRYIADLLSAVRTDDAVVVASRRKEIEPVSIHLPGLLAIIMPRCAEGVYQMIEEDSNGKNNAH